MSPIRLVALTGLAMVAFAGNSILCRLALRQHEIDPASFTLIRLLAGAVVLSFIVYARPQRVPIAGSFLSAVALFVYAAGFSFAYVQLSTAMGALLLFGAVQATMIVYGFWIGERLRPIQLVGLGGAFAGLIGLLLPGLSAPPLWSAVLMLSAGVAWGVYSLRGRGTGDATAMTAGNFLRATIFAVLLGVLWRTEARWSMSGVSYALASGALASGVGYAVWYSVVRHLKASYAATVQLSVPVLAAVAGWAFLGEAITLRIALASLAILGGIALVVLSRQRG